jgi:hypothetical protein
MGTLFDQPVRIRPDMDKYIDDIKRYVEELALLGYSTKEATSIIRLAVHTAKLMHDIYDRDVKDEQIAGIGIILRDFASNFNQ